jgi:hypothetical protein
MLLRSFQNAFFYLGWPDDESLLTVNPDLTAILKTRRKQKFHPPKQRSKAGGNEWTYLTKNNNYYNITNIYFNHVRCLTNTDLPANR